MRHRDRHHRLLIDEARRRIADPARHRVGEAHVAGEVGVAARRGRLARDAQHLVAVAVELEQLGDDGDLLQQLGVIGAALLQRVPACRRHPADLALELGDGLLHAPGGGLRLVFQSVGQRCLGGAIGDPGLHRAVDGEHEHDEADEEATYLTKRPSRRNQVLSFAPAIRILSRRNRRRRYGPYGPRGSSTTIWAFGPAGGRSRAGVVTRRRRGGGWPGGELSQPAGRLVRSDEELCDEAV